MLSIHFQMYSGENDVFSQKGRHGQAPTDRPLGNSRSAASDASLGGPFGHWATSDQSAPDSNVGGADSNPLDGNEGDHFDAFEGDPFDGLGQIDFLVNDLMEGSTECLFDSFGNSGPMPVLWSGNPNLPVAPPALVVAPPPADYGQKKSKEENKKGTYANANYNYHASRAYQELIRVGKVYREDCLKNGEITKLVRAFRQLYRPGDQVLGRAVRYLPPIAAWLDGLWEDIGEKFLAFAHEWCRENLVCQDKEISGVLDSQEEELE